MSLAITERQAGDVTILDCRGGLTLGEGQQALQDAVKKAVAENKKKLLINLTDATIDSSGIGRLTASYSFLQSEGGELQVLANARIKNVLHIAKLDSVYGVHLDEAAALAAFKTQRQDAGGPEVAPDTQIKIGGAGGTGR